MKTALFLFALSLSLTSFSQSITSKMGGIQTFFTLLSADTLNESNQILIKRDESHYKGSETENQSHGAYSNITSWHLEFSSGNAIGSRQRNKDTERKLARFYLIEFIDRDGKVIAQSYVHNKRVKQWSGNSVYNRYNYSFDLRGLPIVALDRTTTIRMHYLTF